MKYIISLIFGCMLAVVSSQRPPYAPNPVRYPDVASRFRTEEADVASLGNRNNAPDVSTTTVRLPIDARGNVDVVNQIHQWPEDRRPYWFINADAIEANRARPVPSSGVQNVQVNVPARSSFLSSQN